VHLTPYASANAAAAASAGATEAPGSAAAMQAYGHSGPAFVPGAGSKVDLVVTGSMLTGNAGTPDPFVVMYTKASGIHDWVELGRSETQRSNSAPHFQRRFQVDFRFELYQEVRLAVFDRDSADSEDLRYHQLIGITDCVLGRIVVSKSITAELINVQRRTGQKPGSVTILAQESADSNSHVLRFAISPSPDLHPSTAPPPAAAQPSGPSKRLPTTGLSSVFHKHKPTPDQTQQQPPQQPNTGVAGDPLITIVRSDAFNEKWTKVYESAPLAAGHPCEIVISASRLCEGDERRPFKIVLVTGDPQKRSIVAFVESSLASLRNLQPNVQLPTNPSGAFMFHGLREERGRTFLDYFANRMLDINLVVAVDFTSSNGEPSIPGTLHHIDKAHGYPNQYEAAMRAIGNILSIYGADQQIAAYGFGANLPPEWKVSHSFALTGNPLQPFCRGVDNLVEVYKTALSTVQLYGPTVLSEVIRTAATIVARNLESAPVAAGPRKHTYTVLLILTDGVLSDADSTVREIIRASGLPMSIIVVGLGGEDYKKMAWLDASGADGGSGTRLQHGNQFAQRDTVQFVPFGKFNGDLAALASQVLGKIPIQITQYMDLQGMRS